MDAVHILDFELIAYRRTLAFYTQNESLYSKLSFDIKRFAIQRRTHSLQSDELHIVRLSNITVVYHFVTIHHFLSLDSCKHH